MPTYLDGLRLVAALTPQAPALFTPGEEPLSRRGSILGEPGVRELAAQFRAQLPRETRDSTLKHQFAV